jgi:hypothetical protein
VNVLIGMNFYAASGDAARRQARAIDMLRTMPKASCVNLQWPDGRFDVPGIPTLAELKQDARSVTGRDGPRKPVIPEMLDLLAAAAEKEGCRYFLYANADVELTASALERMHHTAREGYAFARTDMDPDTGAPLGPMLFGVDAFAFDVNWWRRHRTRFRAYIGGEPVWDNVYTAILLCHSNGEFVDQPGLLRHERHAVAWARSPYGSYTALLAALDRPYFTLWAVFHAELTVLRSAGAGAAADDELRRRVFTAAAARRGWLVQQLRAAKARARYTLLRDAPDDR